MKYFGIKTPKTNYEDSYIWWIANDFHGSWRMFFTYPGRENNCTTHRLPIGEARKAYESIGYKCVELDVKIKETENGENENGE